MLNAMSTSGLIRSGYDIANGTTDKNYIIGALCTPHNVQLNYIKKYITTKTNKNKSCTAGTGTLRLRT